MVMMNKQSKTIITILILLTACIFMSCQTEVTLTLQKDDSLDIRFEGGAGQAFSRMISAAAGLGSNSNGDMLIDTDSVSYELAKSGFFNVKVNQKKGGSVVITMTDKKQTSYLFTSKILKADKEKLTALISPESLKEFYDSSDEQTRMILDLFLAPVFNDEEMTEEEYIEMTGAFYGEGAAKEVKDSTIKINLIAKDGSKQTIRYPLAQLLCGNFNY